MNDERIYAAAFAFRKTRLWKKLDDTELFAVRFTNGKTGYCSITGMLDDHLSLQVYTGAEELASMFQSSDAFRDMPSNDESLLLQHALICSFELKDDIHPAELRCIQAYCTAHQLNLRGKDAYPCLERAVPYALPWRIDKQTEREMLCEALEAACALSGMLKGKSPATLGLKPCDGFTTTLPMLEWKKDCYVLSTAQFPVLRPAALPSPALKNEILLARAAKARCNGNDWVAGIFVSPKPSSTDDQVEDELPKHAPVFPLVFLLLELDGDMLSSCACMEAAGYADKFAGELLDAILNTGRPKRLLVQDMRAAAMLQTLCARLGIELKLCQFIPSYVAAMQDLKEQVLSNAPERESRQLEAMLNDPDFIHNLPDEALQKIFQLIIRGNLSPEYAKRIEQELALRNKPEKT